MRTSKKCLKRANIASFVGDCYCDNQDDSRTTREALILLNQYRAPVALLSKGGTSNTHFGYIFGVSSYDYNAKYVPTSLRAVIITGGTSIGDYAFAGCSGLTTVYIDSLTVANSINATSHRGLLGYATTIFIKDDLAFSNAYLNTLNCVGSETVNNIVYKKYIR